ncbi:MAG TPA: hypothetical protein VMT00_13310 [Thermoanaerobaculia bacterium]|nr:hypothetical protein [Thermoanaerobaculia bacterium]
MFDLVRLANRSGREGGRHNLSPAREGGVVDHAQFILKAAKAAGTERSGRQRDKESLECSINRGSSQAIRDQ